MALAILTHLAAAVVQKGFVAVVKPVRGVSFSLNHSLLRICKSNCGMFISLSLHEESIPVSEGNAKSLGKRRALESQGFH